MEAAAQEKLETEVIKTSAGNLEITFIGHGTLMFTFGERSSMLTRGLNWLTIANCQKLISS